MSMTIKQVIVVRTDLDMGKGKIAAQVGHACVLGAEHVRKSNPDWFSEWWKGQEKVVLKILNFHIISDCYQRHRSFKSPVILSIFSSGAGPMDIQVIVPGAICV